MENFSHSRQPNRGAATISNKMYSSGVSGGFTGAKTIYDNVYGGPPTFNVSSLAPRMEDYSEIFGSFHASRASSIPVLDLPDVDVTEVFLDDRCSSFDYNEVFRCVNTLDFAVSFEDLVNRSDFGDTDSNEEVWNPAASNSLFEEFVISGTDHLFSNGDPYHSFDGSPEFNISYHKANNISNEDVFNGISHVTELHAIPGFACMVNEVSKVQQKNAEKPSLQVTDDSGLSTDYNLEKRKAKHLKETVLHPTNDSCAGKSFENDIRPHRYYRNNSRDSETFVSISEINLRTHPSQVPPPSRPPPLVEGTKGDSSKFVSDYSSVVSEGTSDDSSPSFFDVEIDAISSSAPSAAAIREAMENAKAKLKSVKEQMENKKESFQNSTGLGSKKDIKEEESVSKIVDRSSRMKDERVKGTCERESNGANLSVREEKKKVRKTALEVQDVLEGESSLKAPEKIAKENHGKESWIDIDSCKIDEAREWKESKFFELVTIDESMKDFELTCTKKSLAQGIKVHSQKEKAAMETLEEQSEYVTRAKPVIEDHDLLELEKKHKVRIESFGLEETKVRSVPVRKASEQKNHENKTTVATENREPGKNENYITIDEIFCETEKKISGSDIVKNYNDVIEAERKERKSIFNQNLERADKVVQIRKIPNQFPKNLVHKDIHEAFEKEAKEKMLLEAFEVAGNVKGLKIIGQEVNEKRSKELLEKVENNKKLEVAMKQQDNERMLKVDFEQLENEKRLRGASKRRKSKKTPKEASQKEEYEKQLRGAPEQDQLERTHKKVEIDDILNFSYERTEVRKSVSSCESEDNRMSSIEAQNNHERQAKAYEAFEQVETLNVPKKASECEETAKIFKPSIDLEERKGLKKVCQNMEKDEINREKKSAEANLVHGEEEGKSIKINTVSREQATKSPGQNHLHMEEEDLCICDEPCELVDFMKTFLPNRFYNIDESIEAIKAFGKVNAHEHYTEMTTDCRINEKQSRTVEMEDVSLCESTNASDRAVEELQRDNCQSSMKDANKFLPLDDSINRVSGEIERENSENGMNKCRVQDSDTSLPSNNFMEATEGDAVVEQLHEKKTKSFPQVDYVPDNQERDFSHQHKERRKEVNDAQIAPIQEWNRDKVMPTLPTKEFVEDMRETGAFQLADPEGKQKSQKSAQQATQTSKRRGKNIVEPFTPEDKEKEKMNRERELENERLRKIEEEREREKEREKDRMAVDLATLAARKKAYAEAPEKPERAAVERMTTEARQRAMAEVRERLERACAETREKSSAGKAAMEAKIRAERAAVERAMAEAREHAAEKAKAERAAFEAREQVQRSVSDKFSTSRNNVMRQSYSSSDLLDVQFQSTRNLRYTYSSTYGERYEGVECESAQRCKARLERHRRTAERAAKALAEKNTLDLIAQREQAERNRIAETLDADVRRWSSGKEGNLRSLLSTLQYILGPDSGWQPIPLTEVITSAAVKKYYRKATLCVHPDKLQQRGASIQQKYTCEKVFDMLKEAWNKFNSEEI